MGETIESVKVKDRGITEVYIGTSQGGGFTIVLKPGMEIHQWLGGKFHIEVDKEEIAREMSSTYIGGYVSEKEREKINNLVRKGRFKSVNDIVEKAVEEFIRSY